MRPGIGGVPDAGVQLARREPLGEEVSGHLLCGQKREEQDVLPQMKQGAAGPGRCGREAAALAVGSVSGDGAGASATSPPIAKRPCLPPSTFRPIRFLLSHP